MLDKCWYVKSHTTDRCIVCRCYEANNSNNILSSFNIDATTTKTTTTTFKISDEFFQVIEITENDELHVFYAKCIKY